MDMAEDEEVQNQPKSNAPNQINFHELVVEDRISALPDSLLLEILSRLRYTEEAIRTGTLSKRWKHLWTFVPCLYFCDDYEHDELSDFVSYVDQTLAQCRQLKLKKFVVYSAYDTQFESQINSWIRYAVSCNVEELNLDLGYAKSKFLLDQSFFINTSFTDLRLRGCIVNPIEAITWKNLRRFSMSYERLEEVLLENILSGSPVLETLVLISCYGYRRLNITSKSVKKLEFVGYNYLDHNDGYDLSDVIEINAPNILSLTIEGVLLLEKILLLNVSSLVEANLNFTIPVWGEREEEEEVHKGLIPNLCHVSEVKIGYSSSEILSRLEAKGFSIPSNVKLPNVFTPSYSDDDDDDDWLEITDLFFSGLL